MEYLKYLSTIKVVKQNEIEDLLEKYKSQPVGTGCIDIITANNLVDDLIKELTNINVVINGVTWWCHCSDTNKERLGCPHGMGSPISDFYNGWFSEMCHLEMYDIPENELQHLKFDENTPSEIKSINERIKNYIKDFSNHKDYTECLTPALWLHVPNEWKRVKYLIAKDDAIVTKNVRYWVEHVLNKYRCDKKRS